MEVELRFHQPMLAPVPSDANRRAAIAAAIICVAVVGMGLSLSIPLLSLEMERMGASSTMIGLNTAIAGLASIVTLPFVPRLAAKVGVLRLLLLSIALGAISLLCFRLILDLAWWFPIRFLFSTALGALFALSEFWIADAAPPERRGLVMGIYATVLALGFAAGPTLLLAFGTEGWPPYLAGAALIAAAMIPLVLARNLSPRIEHAAALSFLSYLRLVPVATLAALVFGSVETGAFAILPLYGLRLGFEAQTAAALVSAMALGNVLFQIPVGLIADRVDKVHVLLTAATLGALGAALMPAASSAMPLLVALLFFWGGIVGTLYTVGLAHLSASVRGPELAGANAAFVALYSTGLILGPPLAGGGLDLFPPQGFAWSLAGLLAAYAGSVLWVRSRARPRAMERRAAPPR